MNRPTTHIYRRFNIGKGATGDLLLTITNNCCEVANGSYKPALSSEECGEAAGSNNTF
jgi:hypothetical protein